MRAIRIHAYGGPEQLRVEDVPEPHAGPGEIRIRVSAASINPFDGKVLGGALAGGAPLAEPIGFGFDASGVVDELGDGVDGVQLGDDVFGLGSQTQAEHAVLTAWVAKPASLDWAVAGAAGVASETAIRTLDLLGVGAGSTVLIDGGSGGVGAAAVQIAVARGATVVATAGPSNQDYLREIRATPVVYGEGWAERVAATGVGPFDGVFDAVGKTPIAELTALVDDPAKVVSIANFSATEAGARLTTGGDGDKVGALTEAARLLESSQLVIKTQTFPLDRAAEGYEAILSGHTRGKIVLLP
ncbi:NADP-dependent oxidoreductase [Microlunatus aurantiacus]|uniref:NADP-dependent oxidoreductase n=1 Tax=Microlunatus aurantiacus TaxID=446786 RepID=A0ABP7CTM4_9ACTN